MRTCLQCNQLTSQTELHGQSGIKAVHAQHIKHTARIAYLGVKQLSTNLINSMFSAIANDQEHVKTSNIPGDINSPRNDLNVCIEEMSESEHHIRMTATKMLAKRKQSIPSQADQAKE